MTKKATTTEPERGPMVVGDPTADVFGALATHACAAWYQTHAAKTGLVTGPHLVEGHIADIFRGLSDAGMNFFEIAAWIKKAIQLYQQLAPQIADVATRIQAIIAVIVSLWQEDNPVPVPGA